MIELSTLNRARPPRWESDINDLGRHIRRLKYGDIVVAVIERMPGGVFCLHNFIDGEVTEGFESGLEARREIEADLAERFARLARRNNQIWR